MTSGGGPWISCEGAQRFHDVMQGLFALAGVVGIVTAAWLYFDERRNKPRIVLEPTATVVPLAGVGATREVLLQVRISIENRSSKGMVFNCAAIDLIGLQGTEARARHYADDLQGISLLNQPGGELWDNCAARFEMRRAREEVRMLNKRRAQRTYVNPPRPTPTAKSGARYRDFFMEPGEIATKTYEAVVPCSFSAVRVIFKLPKPGSTHDYETKSLVPIADVCDPNRRVSILRFEEQDAAMRPGEASPEAPETAP